MANQFNSIFFRPPKRNRFNLSFQNKLTMRFGHLVPFLVQDVLPGDKFKVGNSHVIRMQPTTAPIMQNVNIYKYYFFVPNRLIWSGWEEFITGGVTGESAPIKPFIRIDPQDPISFWEEGSLLDYLGFPTPLANVYSDTNKKPDFVNPFDVDVLPFAAYNLVWQEYFRDQNLTQPTVNFPLDFQGKVPANMMPELLSLKNKCWAKDEFTSALPWPQRGAQVGLPMSIDSQIDWRDGGKTYIRNTGSKNTGSAVALGRNTIMTPNTKNDLIDVNSGNPITVDNHEGLSVQSTGLARIADLRRSLKVQEFLEALATGGSRYVEVLRRIFGVKSSDGRMQRPIFLGRTMTPMAMDAIAATTENADVTQGNLSGNGISAQKEFVFNRSFEEHGFIIGLICVVPRASYFQGVPEKYLKDDRFKYYWPQFAHIGEQPIRYSRVWKDFNGDSTNDDTFGYEPRYAEYRFNNDEVHGEFRTTLRRWHMARAWTTEPSLNTSFVEVSPKVADNVFSVDSFHAAPLLCAINNNILASRSVSKYGTPQI